MQTNKIKVTLYNNKGANSNTSSQANFFFTYYFECNSTNILESTRTIASEVSYSLDLYRKSCLVPQHELQVNLDMTDSMGPGKLVRHMQNLSYTYDEYLICIGLGPSISSIICKTPSCSGPSYPSSPVLAFFFKQDQYIYLSL